MKNKIKFNYSDREKYSMIQINEFEEFSINNNTLKEEKRIKYLMKISDVEGVEKNREFDDLKSIEKFFGFELLNIISIEFTTKDGKVYYWASKNFHLKTAWNIFEWSWRIKTVKTSKITKKSHYYCEKEVKYDCKLYRIRDTILSEMHTKLMQEHCIFEMKYHDYSYKNLKELIGKYGKTNENILKEIISLSGMWKCTNCGEIKPKSEFYKNKNETPTSWCSSCYCKKTKEAYDKNIEYYREKGRNYRLKNKKYGEKDRKLEEKKLHQENHQKKCVRCGEVKSESEFYKSKNGILYSWCKPCYSKIAKGYRVKNNDKVKERHKKYYLEHKEYYKEYKKKYTELHDDKLYQKDYQKKYYTTDAKKLSILKIRLKVAVKQETKDKLIESINLLTEKIKNNGI
jgi:hypothetical protein